MLCIMSAMQSLRNEELQNNIHLPSSSPFVTNLMFYFISVKPSNFFYIYTVFQMIYTSFLD